MAGQVWSVSADGGYMWSGQLSDYLRMVNLSSVRYRQFCDPEDHSTKGLGTGDAFQWNVYSKVATKGGAIGETQAIPETKFTITQGSGTVTEYGNSVPYTKKLDDLSQHDVKTMIDKVLKVDSTEAFDDASYAQFDASPLVVAATGGTSTTAVSLSTTGSTTVTSSVALGKGHVAATANLMKERNIPGYFDNGDYGCVGRPTTFATLDNDLEAIHQYVTPGFDLIMNGEKGRYRGVRFFEQTQIASKGWSATDQAVFFGGDTVHEAIVISEEIRGKIPTGDFGRDKGVAWYYLGGFKLVHSSIANARIVKWESAA